MFNCESTTLRKKWIYCLKKLSGKSLEGLKWQSDWGEEPEIPQYLKEHYEKTKSKIEPNNLIPIPESEKSSPVKEYLFKCIYLFIYRIRKDQPLITPRPFTKAKSANVPSNVKIADDASEPPRYKPPRKTMLPTVDELKKTDMKKYVFNYL